MVDDLTRPFKGDVLIFDGMHSRVIAVPEIDLAMKIFPSHLRENAIKEYKVLLLAEGKGIKCIPKPISLIDRPNFVIILKEFIDGVYFDEYISSLDEEGFKKLTSKLLRCLHDLDKFNIVIEELSSPRKNIVIRNGNPYLIDLERWSYKSKSTNVTRFLGFILKMMHSDEHVGNLVNKIWSKNTILEASKIYKENKDLNEVLSKLDLK